MADISMDSYNASGFGQTSGVQELQGQVANYPTNDSALRQQAVDQYADTYAAEQKGFQTQISALIKSQADDSALLNKQYEKSVSSMMAQLQKRGMAIGGLPSSQTDALNRFRNEVMTERQNIYGTQKRGVEALQRLHTQGYEDNIRRRMTDNRNYNLEVTNNLLANIAELQSNSYQAYVDWLNAKEESRSGGSSGGRRYSYGSGGSGTTAVAPTTTRTSLNADYFKASVSDTPQYRSAGGGGKWLRAIR